MDAHCLIGCYRELLRRVAAIDKPETVLWRFRATEEIPHSRACPVVMSGSLAAGCPAVLVEERTNRLPLIEVLDEWSRVATVMEQLSQEPFFSFDIQAFSAGKNARR